jgi:hypothetical protein
VPNIISEGPSVLSAAEIISTPTLLSGKFSTELPPSLFWDGKDEDKGNTEPTEVAAETETPLSRCPAAFYWFLASFFCISPKSTPPKLCSSSPDITLLFSRNKSQNFLRTLVNFLPRNPSICGPGLPSI